MAVTSIWRVKGSVNKVILYATNQQKTEVIELKTENMTDENILNTVLDYTEREDATEVKKYVSGINCSVKNPAKEMLNVKKHFGKTGGTVAYHGYQSFTEDEVDADTAHKIGCELAEKLWGERYQVVVTTHLDKHSHIHNHFVLNTVSFIDGKKYHRTKSDYNQMRELSDRLCEEYGLSTIENPKTNSGKNHSLYDAEKNGEWSKDLIIKRDIDECIKLSISQEEFIKRMKRRGYTFDFTHKYATVSHRNFERARRLKTLGDDYTPESLVRRIEEPWRNEDVDIPKQEYPAYEMWYKSKPKNYQSVYVQFVTVVSVVKQRPNSNRNLYKLLGDEIRKLDRLIEQQNLLCANDIDTEVQLKEYKDKCKNEVAELTEARERLRKMLKKAERNGNEQEITELKEDISNLSARLKKLRRDLLVIERIEEQEPKIEDKIDKAKESNMKEVAKDERFGRRR